MTSTDEYPLNEAQQRSHRLALRLILPLTILLAIIVVPLYLIYDVSKVEGHSMLPTLRNGDYLLITRGIDKPRRGDVLVIHVKNPDGSVSEIVKRAVGLAGDRGSVQGDYVTVNGRPEQFDHLAYFATSQWPTADVVIPPGYVYVLGDNRPVSSDSRFIGALSLGDIHGKVVAVWFPVGRMRLVPSP